jgi:hypothetical protein
MLEVQVFVMYGQCEIVIAICIFCRSIGGEVAALVSLFSKLHTRTNWLV